MKYIFLLLFLSISTSNFAQPNNALLQKGIRQYEKQNWTKAENFFDKAIAQDEMQAVAYCWKAKCLLQFQSFGEAYDYMQIALQLEPTNPQWHLEQGDLKMFVGQSSINKTAECNDCGKKILPYHDGSIIALDYYQSAIVDYKQAQALAPQNGAIAYQLAVAYRNIGQQTDACSMMQTAQKLNYKLALTQVSTFCD